MFALQCLAVFSVAYGLSALVGEIVFTSPQERSLPAALRASLGFVFLVAYFAAAWALMSVENAWMLGAGLLALYWLATREAGAADGWRTRLGQALRGHATGYLACLGGVLLFLAPLGVALESGPFTEGGGDVSIYADGTKFLVDRGLTAKAAPGAGIRDVMVNAREAAHVTLDRGELGRLAMQRYIAADRALINPPSTENAVYRMLTLQSMSAFLYAPYGLFSFLATSTNYHVYFGIQAFVYAILLVSAWHVFRGYRRRVAFLYLGLVGGSHALVSVYYNMYSAQAISVAISALTLALVPRIRVFSAAGMRAYAIAAIYLLVSYVHFLSVTIPLLAIAVLGRRHEEHRGADIGVARPPARSRRFLQWAIAGIVCSLFALLLLSAAQRSILLVTDLLTGSLSGEKNIYMGGHVAAFSPTWMSFLFGIISQQHLRPFATPELWLMILIYGGVAAGAGALALGFALIARLRWSAHGDASGMTRYALTYVVLMLTAALHIGLSQAYLYTQAKGAQDVLVVLYAGLVLPFAVGLAYRGHDRTADRLTRALGVALFCFLAILLIVRGEYGVRLAHGVDRAAILEPSFFGEAERIRREDDKAFVLFEPRKSADLYVSVQPFAGAKMVPTRHLAVSMLVFEGGPPGVRRIDASALLGNEELAHVWTLSAERVEGRYRWKGERLISRRAPALLLFADDYEQDFGRRPRSADKADEGMFSYMRNGSGMLYLPAGGPHELVVTLAARDADKHGPMVRELKERLAKGEFAGELSEEGQFVRLRQSFAPSEAPRLMAITRFGGEYWLNARLDGKDLASSEAATSGAQTVSGTWIKQSSGAAAIRATWSGVRSPDRHDWIGVFPFGGKDASRLSFAYTDAKKEGTVTIPLPAGTVDRVYEVRLFRAGGWNVLATSAPIPRDAAP